MKSESLLLSVIDVDLAIAQLPSSSPIPEWAESTEFCAIARTAEELSIVCPTGQVPKDVAADFCWKAIKLKGPFDFELTGILAGILAPLADAGVGIFAISTFNTDYVLVKAEQLIDAKRALLKAGYTFVD